MNTANDRIVNERPGESPDKLENLRAGDAKEAGECARQAQTAEANLDSYAEAMARAETNSFEHGLRFAAAILVLQVKWSHGQFLGMIAKLAERHPAVSTSSVYRYTGPLRRWLQEEWSEDNQLTTKYLRSNPQLLLRLTEDKLKQIVDEHGTLSGFSQAFPRPLSVDEDVEADDTHANPATVQEKLAKQARAFEAAVHDAIKSDTPLPKIVEQVVQRLYECVCSDEVLER